MEASLKTSMKSKIILIVYMIEVLKHGKTFYHKICDKCGCEFIYQHYDMSLKLNDNQKTYSYKVCCPDCKTYVKADKKIYNENINETVI